MTPSLKRWLLPAASDYERKETLVILAEKKLPDGRFACLNQPSLDGPYCVELATKAGTGPKCPEHARGQLDVFTFAALGDAQRVFDALPPARL